MTMWMVRAESGGALFQKFMEQGAVAIGWTDIGSLEGLNNRDDILRKIEEEWPDWKPKRRKMAAGCLYRIKKEIVDGDYVVTYDPTRRVYAVGTIAGPYRFQSGFDPDYGGGNIRPVSWQGEVARDSLSTQAKNSLGAISTLFRLPPEVEKDILSVLAGEDVVTEEDQEADEDVLLQDMEAKSREFVKDQIVRLDWEDMQELVAGLLRAMGYKTRVSAKGADRGKDIVASPDGFGFEDPRIVVEVKHRSAQMGSQEIRSFVGGRHPNDKGLYVSTGGFSKDAYYEADRANIPVTLMGIDELVDAVLENYEKMDMDTQRLLPLKRLYWPMG